MLDVDVVPDGFGVNHRGVVLVPIDANPSRTGLSKCAGCALKYLMFLLPDDGLHLHSRHGTCGAAAGIHLVRAVVAFEVVDMTEAVL